MTDVIDELKFSKFLDGVNQIINYERSNKIKENDINKDFRRKIVALLNTYFPEN